MTAAPHRDETTDRDGDPAELRALEPEVTATVRRWLDVAAGIPADPAAAHLAAMLKDEHGLAFTVGFVDGVIRPEDPRVAARNLATLARRVPAFLPWHLRTGVRLGALAARIAPGPVIAVVRRALRHMVGHLVIDARPAPLGRAIRRLRRRGLDLNLNLLGEAVLGAGEAARRLEGTRALLARDDVDYVSIKVSSTVAPHSAWAFDDAVAHIAESLTPLFRDAAATRPATFVNLDMEEYRDLALTVAVFTRLLDAEEFRQLRAGIVLQAYLPDALATMIELQDWAARRVAAGGAPIKIRIVKGANLPMERVEAAVHGWPLATWHTKQDTDTNYKRLLDHALHPERTAAVGIGVAGHNLFDVAFAWLLARRRGVTAAVDFEMLLGMAAGQAEAVRRDVGRLLLYTPVVRPAEFDVAIAYLVRRLEEGASSDNFMSAVFDVHDDAALFAREHERFVASLDALDRTVPLPHRRQDRTADPVPPLSREFANTPDTDPSVRVNERWGAAILRRVPASALGCEDVAAATVADTAALDHILVTATGARWRDLPAADRATVLRRAAVELERRRADLIEVMASECGKTIDQGDPEVSEAIDFANYYASLAERLDQVDGATHRPAGLIVVTPPWNFPVAIPAGSTLAALAAGSAVVVKPAPQAQRCAAVLIAALHAAGVPADALQLAVADEGDVGRSLVADSRVGRVILTGAYETAELFRAFRPDLPLLAETSGKNAIVVTPGADYDLAVRDVVASAFGHAGQKCSAASLLVLVGSAARSARLRTQLADAVRSLQVGPPERATSRMGPLIEPATGKLRDALTVLGPGESWLVEPRRLDDAGRLWSPGVRLGVRPGSAFHLTEYFGPVLGVMTVATLAEAVEVQNAVAYGLTAGLQSLDADEIGRWLATVEAGNLYVNRGITGAIVRRQPFGGWKRSAVGAGTKAGGPNYLVGLSDWTAAAARADAALLPAQRDLLAALPDDGALRRALRSDAAAWTAEFGTVRDVSQLGLERNLLRYLPHPVLVRHADGPASAAVRVAAAGMITGAPVTVSSPAPLPGADVLARHGLTLVVEDDTAFCVRLRNMGGGRVRLVGGRAGDVYAVVGGRPDLAVYDGAVTEAGRLELLPFLREQAISITAHRFGTPDHLTDEVLPETPPQGSRA